GVAVAGDAAGRPVARGRRGRTGGGAAAAVAARLRGHGRGGVGGLSGYRTGRCADRGGRRTGGSPLRYRLGGRDAGDGGGSGTGLHCDRYDAGRGAGRGLRARGRRIHGRRPVPEGHRGARAHTLMTSTPATPSTASKSASWVTTGRPRDAALAAIHTSLTF